MEKARPRDTPASSCFVADKPREGLQRREASSPEFVEEEFW